MANPRSSSRVATFPAAKLDAALPAPLYLQLAQQIEAAILDGTLASGDRLDNEIDLAAQLEVSRQTVRRAIQDLVAKGVLVRKRGVGTQILGGRIHTGLASLYDELQAANRRPSTAVLRLETQEADANAAAALSVPTGSEVYYIERLRYADQSPVAIMRNWLPAATPVPDREELERSSLYAALRARGVNMSIARQVVSATPASPAQARLLGVAKSSPLMTMRSITYRDSGAAVEYGSHFYRPDQYAFEITRVCF